MAIDGTVLRRSFDRASGKSPLHMVSAWGCEQRMVLAQIATDAKSNEITAVPKLLDMLSLKGTIVTADALNCQREIARKIVEKGGDYALALKANQGTLHDDVRQFLDDPEGAFQMTWPDACPLAVFAEDVGGGRIAGPPVAFHRLRRRNLWPASPALRAVVGGAIPNDR